MSRLIVSEEIPKSSSELQKEIQRLSALNEQLVRELEGRKLAEQSEKAEEPRNQILQTESDRTTSFGHGDPRKTEEAFRESEARFRQVTDNISEVLWLQAHDYSSLLYISPAYE